MIYQQNFNEDLGRTLTAKGRLVGYDENENIIRYIQIPDEHKDDDGNLYQFNANTFIYGSESNKVVEAVSYNEV